MATYRPRSAHITGNWVVTGVEEEARESWGWHFGQAVAFTEPGVDLTSRSVPENCKLRQVLVKSLY